jgi:uncharacterized membrane-anchored protein YhcB (DUF1043 family)|tara:strand:+ start:735 stop:1007 length:273 start_codon:yes stop_codon:yes gene_type:complete
MASKNKISSDDVMLILTSLAKLETKLDSKTETITAHYLHTKERLDKLEEKYSKLIDEISKLKEVQAKHAVIVTVAATVFSAIVVQIIRGS